MKQVLSSIIHKDQTGFLCDRYIGQNITLFLDVQEYLAKDLKPGLAFLADWEKAYDLADRSFLREALLCFGFGPNFIQWFTVLHAGSLSKLIINSFLSDPFEVNCGVRQGCPPAPLLFLCVVEPLAQALRNSHIGGIALPPHQNRLVYLGYADDTTVYMSSMEDLNKVLNVFNEFSSLSGMKLNTGKCVVIPLGSFANLPAPASTSFRWLTERDDLERLLGVPVGLKFQSDAIWKDLLTKLHDSVQHWTSQNLSVYGRVHAARSYIGAKAWFLATVIPPNSEGIKRLLAMLWAYVQNNRTLVASMISNRHYSPWPRQTLIQKKSIGGLNAEDFLSHLKAIHSKWIFKLLDPRHLSSCKSLPFHFFERLVPGLAKSVFLTDPSILQSAADRLPERWYAYMEAWLSSGLMVSPPPLDDECILNEPIWFNRFLYLPTDTKRGTLLNPGLEKALLSRGFTHLADLISSQLPAGNYDSPWLSLDEATFKAGSRRLGNALLSIIGLIPHAWSLVVSSRSREPFCIDNWIVCKSEAHF
jgi:hypothetical protein